MRLGLPRESPHDGQAPALTGTVPPRGSALANTISQFILVLLLFLYILWKKLHHTIWEGKVCCSFSSSDVGLVSG